MERTKEFSSDPVCYHAEEQGVGGLNIAACYSCALLPETSCEELNCFLDRRLLVDNDYGFLKVLYCEIVLVFMSLLGITNYFTRKVSCYFK